MINVTNMKLQLKALTARSALKCIAQKGAPYKVFYWDSLAWTPRRALDVWESEILDMKCGEVGVVRFFGGPPPDPTWYSGSILSMLCDLLLFDTVNPLRSEEDCSWLGA